MQSRSGWIAYAPLRRETLGPDGGRRATAVTVPNSPTWAGSPRRLVRQVVHVARAEETSTQRLLAGHLGGQAAALPVASGSWERYDHVNVQAGLDAWLAEPGRGHEIAGITGFRHQMFGLADLTQSGGWTHGLGLGSVTTDTLPSGPGGATRSCVQCALYLITEDRGPLALLLRGPEEHSMVESVTVEVTGGDRDRVQRVIDDIRRLAVEHNVFRGHVIEFGSEVFGHGRATPLKLWTARTSTGST